MVLCRPPLGYAIHSAALGWFARGSLNSRLLAPRASRPMYHGRLLLPLCLLEFLHQL